MVKHNNNLRNFCFTFNNYTDDSEKILQNYIKAQCKYGIYGREIGANGTKHLQGYCELTKRTRFTTVHKAMQQAHLEPRKGTAKQASDYCRKDDAEPFEFGTISNAGKRNDIVALRDEIKSGATLKDIIEDDRLTTVFAKYPRYYNRVAQIYAPRRSETTELIILHGPTGTGKSHYVITQSPDVYYKDLTSPQFWDGYDGKSDVVFEDFRGEISLVMMLRLADKYPMQVQVKGGSVNFSAKKIYITSNLDPEEWFNNTQKGYCRSMEAFRRRITQQLYMDKPYVAPSTTPPLT